MKRIRRNCSPFRDPLTGPRRKSKLLEYLGDCDYDMSDWLLHRVKESRDDLEIIASCTGSKDPLVRYNSVSVLCVAAEMGFDITPAVDELGEALSNDFPVVRWKAAIALGAAAKNGNQETRERVDSAVSRFECSEWFNDKAKNDLSVHSEMSGIVAGIRKRIDGK